MYKWPKAISKPPKKFDVHYLRGLFSMYDSRPKEQKEGKKPMKKWKFGEVEVEAVTKSEARAKFKKLTGKKIPNGVSVVRL